MDSTPDSHADNPGSIPGIARTFDRKITSNKKFNDLTIHPIPIPQPIHLNGIGMDAHILEGSILLTVMDDLDSDDFLLDV